MKRGRPKNDSPPQKKRHCHGEPQEEQEGYTEWIIESLKSLHCKVDTLTGQNEILTVQVSKLSEQVQKLSEQVHKSTN